MDAPQSNSRLLPLLVLFLVLAAAPVIWWWKPPQSLTRAAPTSEAAQDVASDVELWEALEDSSSDTVSRQQAAVKLSRRGPEIFPRLKRSLTSSDPTVRRLAVRILWEAGPIGKPLLPDLLKRFDDSEESVAAEAMTAASRVDRRDPAFIEKLFDQQRSQARPSIATTASSLLAAAIEAGEISKLVTSLDELGDEQQKILVRGLSSAAKSLPLVVRNALIERLARNDEPPAMMSLFVVMAALPEEDQAIVVRAAHKSPSPFVRGEAAIKLLAKHPQFEKEFEEDVRGIVLAAKDDAARMTSYLRRAGRSKAALKPLVTSDDPEIRFQAARAIRPKAGEVSLIAPLLEGLSRAKNPAEQMSIIYDLLEVGPAAAEVLPVLEKHEVRNDPEQGPRLADALVLFRQKMAAAKTPE